MQPQDIYNALKKAGLSLQEAVERTDKAIAALDAQMQSSSKRSSIRGLLSKQAFISFPAKVDRLIDFAAGVGANATAAALVATPVMAYHGGKFLAKHVDDTKQGVQELQEGEMLSELQENIDKLRRQRELKERGMLLSASPRA